MKDFLDVLLEQMQQQRTVRDEAVYLSRLKALATSAPPLRKIPGPKRGRTLKTLTLDTAPDSRIFAQNPDAELFFYKIKDAAEPRWFRLAKEIEPERPFGRLDPVQNEAQVLESIAMGADVYSLSVREHDAVTLQYLAEVGADYEVPVLLRCAAENELARALFVKAKTWIGLEGAVAVPELLELPIFDGRKIIILHSET